MRKSIFLLFTILCFGCQGTRPEQTNYYLSHDDERGTVENLVNEVSHHGKIRTERASYDLNDDPGDDLRVYNIVLPNFTIFIQDQDDTCNPRPTRAYVFVNIARWKSGGTESLADVDKAVRETAKRLGWQAEAEVCKT